MSGKEERPARKRSRAQKFAFGASVHPEAEPEVAQTTKTDTRRRIRSKRPDAQFQKPEEDELDESDVAVDSAQECSNDSDNDSSSSSSTSSSSSSDGEPAEKPEDHVDGEGSRAKDVILSLCNYRQTTSRFVTTQLAN